MPLGISMGMRKPGGAVIPDAASQIAAIGCGSAVTVLVDGVTVPGGTATNATQLHTALTVGPWHVLEMRNLNLSTFSLLEFSLLGSYQLGGDIGGVVLCPAQSGATRTAIRQYLGAKVGLSL